MQRTGVLPGSDYYFFPEEEGKNSAHLYPVLCGHYHCTYGYSIKRNYYEYILLTYIAAGSFYFEYDGHSYEAQPGEIVIMDCQKPHFFRSGQELEFIWIHFSGGLSHALCQDVNRQFGPLIRHGYTQYLKEHIYSFVSAFRNRQQPTLPLLSSQLHDMMCHLYPPRLAEENMDKSNRAVALAVEYMRYHLDKPISIDDLASVAHMSRYHFSRVFRDVCGFSPYDYLLRLRLDLAKHLLKTTRQSIREIAFAVGYQSEVGFATAFTEKIGVTPGQYRHMPI